MIFKAKQIKGQLFPSIIEVEDNVIILTIATLFSGERTAVLYKNIKTAAFEEKVFGSAKIFLYIDKRMVEISGFSNDDAKKIVGCIEFGKSGKRATQFGFSKFEIRRLERLAEEEKAKKREEAKHDAEMLRYEQNKKKLSELTPEQLAQIQLSVQLKKEQAALEAKERVKRQQQEKKDQQAAKKEQVAQAKIDKEVKELDIINHPWKYNSNFENAKSVSMLLFSDQVDDIEKTILKLTQTAKLLNLDKQYSFITRHAHRLTLLKICVARLLEGEKLLLRKNAVTSDVRNDIQKLERKIKKMAIIYTLQKIFFIFIFLVLTLIALAIIKPF